MSENLRVLADFDGANPRDEGILRINENHFELNVFSETDIESFRMETVIENNSSNESSVNLEINWPTEAFSELRDCFYWKHERMQDWATVPGETKPGKSFISLNVQPGTGFLCLHPHYGYDDCENYVLKFSKNSIADCGIAGKSEKGRKIRLIKFSSSPQKKYRILVAARNHANESSGNYCIEGMIEWLLSNDPALSYYLKKMDFFFLPMTNPDGVAEGMARFTGLRCADLNKTAKWLRNNTPDALPDSSHETFFKTIDAIKPTHFVNLHSYLFKHKDEIYAYSEKEIQAFTKFFPDDISAGKTWKHKLVTEDFPFPTSYAKSKYGTISFLLEIPWFGRNAESMKKTGKEILKALILMNTEINDNPWGSF
jgi:hypothetical protein